jgi:hypothetical protein
MPKYRQLQTKIVDSFDFAEMPDDFTRVTWLMLIVIVDSEGRGINNPAWLRSRMFPLRLDVTDEMINAAMGWLAKRGMINTYEVDSHGYFEIDKFKEHQSGTDKEARSNLPERPAVVISRDKATPDQLRSYSGVTPDQLRANAMQCNADSNTEAEADSTASAKKQEIKKPSGANAPFPTENLETLWADVARSITGDPHFPRQTAERLRKCKVLTMQDGVMVVQSPDANWLDGHMTSTVERALPGITPHCEKVRFVEA